MMASMYTAATSQSSEYFLYRPAMAFMKATLSSGGLPKFSLVGSAPSRADCDDRVASASIRSFSSCDLPSFSFSAAWIAS